MPLPIQRHNTNPKGDENSFYNDYAFLLSNPSITTTASNKKVEASNQEADMLLKIWAQGEKVDDNSFKMTATNKNEINKLKYRGLVTIKDDVVSFTQSGKIVITTMVLGENNSLDKHAKPVSYKEILASMDKRGKNGFKAPKIASNQLINLNDISK